MRENLNSFFIALIAFSIGVIVAPCEVTTVSPTSREDYSFTNGDETLISATNTRCEIFMTDSDARIDYILDYIAKESRRELTTWDRALYASLDSNRCLGYYD